jgi:hypothetical protein
MPGKPCSCCISPNRAEIDRSVLNRHSGREIARKFGLSASSVARHRTHVALEPAPTTSTGHRRQAEEMVGVVRLLRGTEWSPQEEAETGQLLSLATAVDTDPQNIAALRELRMTLAQFRKGAFRPDEGEQQEMARLVASISLSGRPGLFEEVYATTLAAGATPEIAQIAAQAATAPPDSPWSKPEFPCPRCGGPIWQGAKPDQVCVTCYRETTAGDTPTR